MAEDQKIVPDGPPWEPRNVEITPDTAPWEPHDVSVSPDSGPWDPIDVPLYPDMPPGDPFQVPTYPDGPPWQPHDVPNFLDSPPAAPFDVPTVLDGPPWAPVDVQTQPDAPPWTPTDVQITFDGAPWSPVDVQVTPDVPPDLLRGEDGTFRPHDVQVALDDPPRGPVRIHHKVPHPWEPKSRVTTGELTDRLRLYDNKLANFLDEVGEYVPFVSAAGKGAFDPLILADWLRNYREAVGTSGMIKFVAEQTALYAMNPVVARFFDPTYFARLAIPGYTGMFNTHVELGPFESYTNITIAKDAVFADTMAYQQRQSAQRDQNMYDRDTPYTERQDFSVDDMVEARTQNPPKLVRGLTVKSENPGVARFDAASCFDEMTSPMGSWKVNTRRKLELATGIGSDVASSKLAKSAATNGIIRIPVPGDGLPKPGGSVSYDGAVLSDTTKPDVDDDEVRLPLCFTDLRKDPTSDSYRHVFFQPMNLVVNQSFSPNWNETQAFGRVDQMVGYVGTTRAWSVSFEVHAFAPEDLAAMYHKMTWLTSMVYPTYGADALMRSGPVCRMRIGDLAATAQGGIPGVIRSLSFDFAECLWELQRGMKVPRSFGVQIEYTVLHDGPVGLLNGMFGVIKLPGGPNANLAGTSVPNQQSTDSSNSDSVSIASGHWASFGQPTRKG